MADPFDGLRLPDDPIAPDPAFALRLRGRLARAFALPEGVIVSDLVVDHPVAARGRASAPAATGRAELTVYLAVAGAPEAIAWYGEALGTRLTGDPVVMPDGRIGHAELDVAGARLMLSEEHPEIGVTAPEPGAGATFSLHLSVERPADVDAVIDRCVRAGARLERPAADYPYGRNGVVRDPFGHRWMIASEVPAPGRAAGPALGHGDIGYASLWVPDVERAASFFGVVLGWRYEEARTTGGRRVVDHPLHHGLFGGFESSTLFCCYAVDDVDVAVGRIRAGGGTAGDPREEPYGRLADATDPEGTRFAVFTPPGGLVPRAEAAESRPAGQQGDLVYVTMEVADAGTARAFYGDVLGWEATPGRVADGWNVEGVVPMVGIAGGRPRARHVPMYEVDDVAAAVERVRAAGGTATDPEVQPYGVTAEATDDQGTFFYLGQLGR